MTHEEREQVLSEEDYTELRDRFGSEVESVVRDMISGKGERWEPNYLNFKDIDWSKVNIQAESEDGE